MITALMLASSSAPFSLGLNPVSRAFSIFSKNFPFCFSVLFVKAFLFEIDFSILLLILAEQPHPEHEGGMPVASSASDPDLCGRPELYSSAEFQQKHLLFIQQKSDDLLQEYIILVVELE